MFLQGYKRQEIMQVFLVGQQWLKQIAKHDHIFNGGEKDESFLAGVAPWRNEGIYNQTIFININRSFLSHFFIVTKILKG